MTSYMFGAITVLALWGWAPRLAVYRRHRQWMRRYEQPLAPSSSPRRPANPARAREVPTQLLPAVRPAAPVAVRHWDTGEQDTITPGMRAFGFDMAGSAT